MSNVWNSTLTAALPERARLVLNVAAPAALVMTANAVLMLFGGGADLPRFENVAAAPPDWARAAAWIGVLGALGLSRFELSRSVEPATLAIDALLAAMMIYPFTSAAFGPAWTAANTLTTLAIAVMAFVAAYPQSRRAAGWLAPVLGWLGWTSWLAAAELTA